MHNEDNSPASTTINGGTTYSCGGDDDCDIGFEANNSFADKISRRNDLQSSNKFHERLTQMYPGVEQLSSLPKMWSPSKKTPMIGLVDNFLRCYFRESYRRDEETEKQQQQASVQADQAIPASCLLYYYEIEIISRGNAGCQAIGLSSDSIAVSKLPGWTRDSYGYHGYDGNKFCGSNGKGGEQYGPTFSKRDIVGCGYNLSDRNIFFTKNGVNLGIAFSNVPSNLKLYPTVGLKTSGEEVKANFGQSKFVYNIEQDLQSLRKNVTINISRHKISDYNDLHTTIHKLIQSWLIHNSYPETAETFSSSIQSDFNEDTQLLRQRFEVQQLILKGKISEAIKLTNIICPDLLLKNLDLLLALKCRQFVELIEGSETDFNSNLHSYRLNNNSTNSKNNHSANSSQGNGKFSNGDSHVEQMDDDDDTLGNKNENGVNREADVWLSKLLQFGKDLSDFEADLRDRFGYKEQNEKALVDSLSLIAFKRPHSSLLAWQFDQTNREMIAQTLNNHIQRGIHGESYQPPFDKFVNHLNHLISLNNSHGKWLVDKLQY